MAADEVAEGGVAAKVTPSEDGGGEPNPSGVATPERGDDRDGFVFAEETVFRYEAVTGDADFSAAGPARRLDSQSTSGPQPEKITTSPRVAVIGEDHRHHVVRLTGLATDVDEHEKRAAQQPAPASAIQPQRRPEHRQREPSRRAANAEQRSLPIVTSRRSGDTRCHLDHRSLAGNRRRRSL